MDSELNLLIQSVKEKTGIDVVVFAEGMKFLATTLPSVEVLPPTDKDFKGVYQDVTTGNTYFRLKYKNANLIGYVKGVSKIDKNYATLVAELIENSTGRELQLSKTEYLRSILLGECNKAQIQQFERKFKVPDKNCYVIAISTQGFKSEDIISLILNFDGSVNDYVMQVDENYYAFIKFVDETPTDYFSANDFAENVFISLNQELGITPIIGIGGTVKNITEISISYQQAVMAIRMAYVMNSKGNVHSYKEFMLIKMLEDTPKFKLEEWLDILLDENAKSIFSDSEMTNTAEEFLENSLNVSETSRKLYLHRNTLMYRLDKIERETGLNIRKFSDAVTFRLVTILFKLTK